MASRFVSSFLLLLCLASPLPAAGMTVSAASSLTDAFTAIAEGFGKATGIRVDLNFASSNSLLRQMQGGAPVDVFVSADSGVMDAAEKEGLVLPDTRADIAGTDLVLITPAAGRPASSPEDLLQGCFRRIAVGTPQSVPAGRYAQEALTSAGLWDRLSSRYVFGGNVRQVLGYVQRGEADAGIVYRTDALVFPDKVRIGAVLGGHAPVTYPIAVAARASDMGEARRFVAYVLSPEGQAVLARFGFSPAR